VLESIFPERKNTYLRKIGLMADVFYGLAAVAVIVLLLSSLMLKRSSEES